MSEIQQIPEALQPGQCQTAGELLTRVYAELRRLAAYYLAQEKPGQTLQATALVHEAWLRVAGSEDRSWEKQAQFFAAAAQAMRRILIEKARRRQTLRHGGKQERVDIDALEISAPLPDEDLLALDEAMERLAALDPPAAELIQLRFFVGLTHVEAANILGLSRSAADRTWVFARAWLFQQVRSDATRARIAKSDPMPIQPTESQAATPQQ